MTAENVPTMGPIVISPKELYDDVRTIRDAVLPIPAQLRNLETKVAEHEGRLDALDRKVIWVAGVAAGLAAGAGGTVGTLITKLLA